MTGAETQFLAEANDLQTIWMDKRATEMLLGAPNNCDLLEIRITLLEAFMEILEQYFNYATVDDNFFTEDEIQDIINHINLLMGSTLYIDLS